MNRAWHFRTRPAYLLTLAVAFHVAGFLATGALAQVDHEEIDSAGSVFTPEPSGAAIDHPPIENAATLDGAAAERIYDAIVETMQSFYARSGDPPAHRYTTWRRVNTVPYRSHRHGSIYVNNYANPTAADYGHFQDANGLPPGSVLVKDSFAVTDDGEIHAGPLAIMEKMPAGFDPDNGDWRYLTIGPDGELAGIFDGAGNDPRMKQCAGCHNAAPEGQDRTFYVPPAVRP